MIHGFAAQFGMMMKRGESRRFITLHVVSLFWMSWQLGWFLHRLPQPEIERGCGVMERFGHELVFKSWYFYICSVHHSNR